MQVGKEKSKFMNHQSFINNFIQFNPIFYTGGGSLFAIHNECEMYDLHSDTWITIQPMNVRRARLGVAALHRLIYAVGG